MAGHPRQGFLHELEQTFHLFDAGRGHDAVREIRTDGIDALAAAVDEHPAGWTDLVLLDRRSEVCRWIYSKLTTEA